MNTDPWLRFNNMLPEQQEDQQDVDHDEDTRSSSEVLISFNRIFQEMYADRIQQAILNEEPYRIGARHDESTGND